MPRRRPSSRTSPTLALASLAASLLVVNAAFLLWPGVVFDTSAPPPPPPREQIVLEMVEVTEQPPPPENLPPPPPPDVDLPPVEVPDEVLIEEVIEDLPIPLPEVETPPAQPTRVTPPGPPGPPAPPPPAPPGPSAGSDRIVERPERSPRQLQISLPAYPPDAGGARARVRLKVLISEGGQVLDSEIVERIRLDGGERTVASLPSSMEAEAHAAARRHLFRPGRDGGERIRAYTFITISFDPPR
ncbi:MAG: hypothetical protein AAF845_07305 [Bacteroidota bacterium]